MVLPWSWAGLHASLREQVRGHRRGLPLPARALHHLRALDGTLKRFPLLVYLGPSQTAKTLRMRDFFGAEKTLVVNCKNTLHPNLTQYKDQDAIVWDEATAEFVLVNRGLVLPVSGK